MKASVRARRAILLVHRYVGLTMAAFLVVAGLTGSMMAFYPQLDAVLNPELFQVAPPHAGATTLDPFTLREALVRQLPKGAELGGVILDVTGDRSVNYWLDGKEIFVHPYTGKVLGSRTFGDPSEGRKSLLTFLYRLHFSLALDDVGILTFGVVALLWTLDCFVGLYLTFPLPAQRRAVPRRKSWFAHWLPAWFIKTNKLFVLVFSWHRASGLWVWLMLLIFAWSAVALNLGEQVYSPLMHGLFGKPSEPHLPELEEPLAQKLSWRDAHSLARRVMTHESERRGFVILSERSLDYAPEHGAYGYTVETTLDVSERLAETSIQFDDQGRVLGFSAPTGQHTGSTISSWLVALHFGAVREGGLLYRSFVCLLGFVVTLLSITGVWVWWKKRAAHKRATLSHAHRAAHRP